MPLGDLTMLLESATRVESRARRERIADMMLAFGGMEKSAARRHLRALERLSGERREIVLTDSTERDAQLKSVGIKVVRV